ncbi:MAG: histidine kinase [Archaeoglobi archaeon]|nr:MAG: histidine kinase [Archaeoglobi archaeon]
MHLYANDIFCHATGYTAEELKNMSVLDLVYQEDMEKAKEIIERVSKGEAVFDEIRYVTKDGRVRWVFGLYAPFHYRRKLYAVGNYVDITRIKRLEEKIADSEKFYRMLVDNSLAGIYIIQKGKYVFLNRAAALGAGYSQEEMLGMDPFQIIHPEDRERIYTNYLQREKGIRTEEAHNSWRIVRKDGKIRWVLARARNIVYKGEPAVYVTTIDATELFEANEELKRKNEYLSLLSKLLRHDILNDLAVVRGAIEIKDEEMALQRIDKIVEKIYDIKSLEEASGRLKIVNVADIVNNIVEKYGNQAIFSLNIKEAFVEANEALKSVVDNIVGNAIIHSQVSPVQITINLFTEGNECVLQIADNGIGIPDEIKSKIFETGFSRRGGGLGLFLVKKIVEMFGGRITVRDNVPKGALFEVRLPLKSKVKEQSS